jgi:small GTP-binding protein
MNEYDYLFKFILIGDSTVGKTCILTRFVDGWFKAESDPTIGVEFGSKIIKCKSGVTVRLQVWDTAGQESFRSITRSYYRGAIGALLVYDVTNPQSFESLPNWLKDSLEATNQNIGLVLVGNKCDLENQRKVDSNMARQFAKENNLLFLETSAKNGANIEKIFQILSEQILAKIDAKLINPEVELGIKRGRQTALANSTMDSSGKEIEKLELKEKSNDSNKKCKC